MRLDILLLTIALLVWVGFSTTLAHGDLYLVFGSVILAGLLALWIINLDENSPIRRAIGNIGVIARLIIIFVLLYGIFFVTLTPQIEKFGIGIPEEILKDVMLRFAVFIFGWVSLDIIRLAMEKPKKLVHAS